MRTKKLVKMKVLTQQVRGGVQDSAWLTRSLGRCCCGSLAHTLNSEPRVPPPPLPGILRQNSHGYRPRALQKGETHQDAFPWTSRGRWLRTYLLQYLCVQQHVDVDSPAFFFSKGTQVTVHRQAGDSWFFTVLRRKSRGLANGSKSKDRRTAVDGAEGSTCFYPGDSGHSRHGKMPLFLLATRGQQRDFLPSGHQKGLQVKQLGEGSPLVTKKWEFARKK